MGESSADTEYEYEYIDSVPAALECPICRCALVDPIRTPDCDHLFCRQCLVKSLQLAPRCPIDRNILPPEGIHACTRPHRAVLQLLGDLKVKYEGEQVTRDEADRRRRATAAALDEKDNARDAPTLDDNDCGDDKAEDDDSATPIPCDHCTLLLPRASHPSHLLTSCLVVPLPCPHALRGCPYTGPRTLLEQEHLPSECAYEPLRGYFDKTDERILGLEGENWELRERVRWAEKRLDRLTRVVEGLTASLGEFAPPVAAPGEEEDDTTVEAPSSASTSTARPAPTKRHSSSHRSVGGSASSPPPPPPAASASSSSQQSPSLVSALSHLNSHQSHLSVSLSSLAQSHAHQLGTTLALKEEVGSLRTQLTGVRIQMGGVMRDVYGGGPRVRARGGGIGVAAGGGERGLRVPSAHAQNGGGGSSGSSDEESGPHHQPPFASPPSSYEEDEDTYHLHHHPHQQHAFQPFFRAPSASLPLPLPPGMRAVNQFPLSVGGGGGPSLPIGHAHGHGHHGQNGIGGGGGGGGGGLVKL
ncbi:hypothetical protein JCM10908_007248 [Rhodotorula pacifica]|uniref:uncharacterized protein n=1 Tax=Rhodotorula pacifica TaxID=1495444 RepID=UPI00317310B3